MPTHSKINILLLPDVSYPTQRKFIKALLEAWAPSTFPYADLELRELEDNALKDYGWHSTPKPSDRQRLVKKISRLCPQIIVMHLGLGSLDQRGVESLSEAKWLEKAPRLGLVDAIHKEIPGVKVVTYSHMKYSKAIFLAAKHGAFDFVQITQKQNSWDKLLASVRGAIEQVYGAQLRAFVLMPFQQQFDDIYQYGIKTTCEQLNIACERADEIFSTRDILGKIYENIRKADIVIADLSTGNSNVFYEVGYSHAFDKTVVLLANSLSDVPFDLRSDPIIVYGKSKGNEIKTLATQLRQGLEIIARIKLSSEYTPLTAGTKVIAGFR